MGVQWGLGEEVGDARAMGEVGEEGGYEAEEEGRLEEGGGC